MGNIVIFVIKFKLECAPDAVNNRDHMLYKFIFQICQHGIHVLYTIIASQAVKQ